MESGWSEIKAHFETNGCTVVKNFASEEECIAMKNRMKELVGRFCCNS